MSIRERLSRRVESPFLDFVAESEKEWEPRVAALAAESPFRDVVYEQPPTPDIVPEMPEEGTKHEQESVHEKEDEYQRKVEAALEWEDPGCAGEQASLDVEAEWFDSEIW